MDSYVAYNLWRFLTSVLLLITFIYFFGKTLHSSSSHKLSFIIALLAGVVFILLLDHITYGWTSYPPLSVFGKNQLTAEKYNLVLLFIKIIIAIAIAFLLFRRYKLKSDGVDKGLPK